MIKSDTDTKRFIKDLHKDRDKYTGMVAILYMEDGGIAVNATGMPKADVRAFIAGVGHLLMSASGVSMAEQKTEDLE